MQEQGQYNMKKLKCNFCTQTIDTDETNRYLEFFLHLVNEHSNETVDALSREVKS